jgi:hypothetical protein
MARSAHLGPRQIDADHPSDMTITAYLVLHKRPIIRNPKAPAAVLEFNDPAAGPDPISFLLTAVQLRRLGEALCRLVQTAETPDWAGNSTRTVHPL